jgi:hypothetical protein
MNSTSNLKECFDAIKSHNNIYKEQAIRLKNFIDMKNKTQSHYDISIPIKKIHNIPINATLNVHKDAYIKLHIESSKCSVYHAYNDSFYFVLYCEDLCKYTCNTEMKISDYIKIIEKLNNLLNSIIFDKFNGKFTEKQFEYDITTAIFWDSIIGSSTNIEKKYGTCCVCLESTKTTTYCCNQPLCIECWGNISTKLCSTCDDEFDDEFDDECDNVACNTAPCPLCRKSLEYYYQEF